MRTSETATLYSRDRLRQVLADNWAPCRLQPRRCCLQELITITQKFPFKTSTATWLDVFGKPATEIPWNAAIKGPVTLRAVDVLLGWVNDCAQRVVSLKRTGIGSQVRPNANTRIWWGTVDHSWICNNSICILGGDDSLSYALQGSHGWQG